MQFTGYRLPLAGLVLMLAPLGPAGAMTLDQTVQYAIDTHPDIAEAAANRRATEQERLQAEGLYWPQVDFSGATGPEWTHGGGSVGWDDPEWTNQATLSLTETLFDKGRSAENVRQRARVNASAHRVRERVEVVALDVIQAYLDVLRQREILRLADDNLRAHGETLEKVQQKLAGGQIGIGDLRQAEARYANAKAAMAESQRELDEAEIAFHRTVGRFPKNLVRPVFEAAALPPDVNAAVRAAVDNSPSVTLAAADLDVAQTEIRQSKAEFWPTVDFEVVTTYNDNTNGTLGDRRDTTALLVLNYNLYRGNIDSHAKLEAVRRRDETRETYRSAVRSVEEETRLSWIAIARLRQRLESLYAEELANAQVVATYRQEFDLGQRSLINLLDSENELFNSRVTRMTAEYAEQFAKYRLLASMGLLGQALQVGLPPEAYGYERQSDFEWTTYWNAEARASLRDDSTEPYDGVMSRSNVMYTLPEQGTYEPDFADPAQVDNSQGLPEDLPEDLPAPTPGNDPFAAPRSSGPDPFAAPDSSGSDPFAAPASRRPDPFAAPADSGPDPFAAPASAQPAMPAGAPAAPRRASRWMVLIPPQGSYDDAKVMEGALEGSGFDAYVLTRGEYRYGVSTGQFSEPGNAERLAERLRGNGFDVQVVPWLK